jgi:hypothetical protein
VGYAHAHVAGTLRDIYVSSTTQTFQTSAGPGGFGGLPVISVAAGFAGSYDSLAIGGKTFSAGTAYTLALLGDGTVMAFGNCRNGQCANAQTGISVGSSPLPNALSPSSAAGSPIVQMAAGSDTSCFLASAGDVHCSGIGDQGGLGTGGTYSSNGGSFVGVPTPVDISAVVSTLPLPDTVRVAHVAVGNSFSCLLLNTGNVTCFGSNSAYQMGTTSGSVVDMPTPLIPLPGKMPAIGICAGYEFACALMANNSATCWGKNIFSSSFFAQNAPTPYIISGAAVVTQVTCGYKHVCLLFTTGLVRCAGANDFGQTDISSATTPLTLNGAANINIGADRVSSLFLGPSALASCGVTFAGNLTCWGLSLVTGGAKYNSFFGVQRSTTRELLPPFFNSLVGNGIGAGNNYLPWPVVQAVAGVPLSSIPQADASWTVLGFYVWIPYNRSNGSPIQAYLGPVACTTTVQVNASFFLCGCNANTMLAVQAAGLPALATISWTGGPSGVLYGLWTCPRPIVTPQVFVANVGAPGQAVIAGNCFKRLAEPWGALTLNANITVTQAGVPLTVLSVTDTSITVALRKGTGTQELLVLNNATAQRSSVSNSLFVQFAGPVVSNITTTRGNTTNLLFHGESIAINGRNFGDGTITTSTAVTLGTTACLNVVLVSDGVITCTVPSSFVTQQFGLLPLVVYINGLGSNVLPLRYSAPVISAVVPAATWIYTGGFRDFYILGSNFGTNASVLLDANIAGYLCPKTKLVLVNSSAIRCTNVSLSSLPGNSSTATVSFLGWSAISAPINAYRTSRVLAITPSNGTVGTWLAIEGDGLGFSTDPSALGGIQEVGLQDTNGTKLKCTSNRVSSANLGVIILCELPNGIANISYTPYVQVNGGQLVLNTSLSFKFMTVITLVVSWQQTVDNQSVAVPSSVDYVFPLTPPPAVKVTTDTGATPSGNIVCMLVIDPDLLPISTIQTFLGGNTTVTASSGASVVGNFTYVGVIGGAGLRFYVYTQCSFNGAGPWYQSSRVAVRTYGLEVRWDRHPTNATMPSAEAARNDPGVLVPMQPAPMLSLWKLSSPTSRVVLPITARVSCSLDTISWTPGSVVSGTGTASSQLLTNGSTIYSSIGIVGPFGSVFSMPATCVWITGESIIASSYTGSIANISIAFTVISGVGAAPASLFSYNVPTNAVSSQLSITNGGVTIPLWQSGVLLRSIDTSCTLAATAGISSVLFQGGAISSLNTPNSSLAIQPMSLQPAFATLAQPIVVTVAQTCLFRAQPLPVISFTTAMQNLSIAWVRMPPLNLTSSASNHKEIIPNITVALLNQSSKIVASDMTTSCVLSVYGGVTPSGGIMSRQAAFLDGSTTITMTAGMAIFSGCSLTAPLSSIVTLQMLCTRAEGGPTMSLFVNVSIKSADVAWNVTQGIGFNSSAPIMLYDIPQNVSARFVVWEPRQNHAFRPFAVINYAPALYAPVICSLNIDASVDPAAQAAFAGETKSYQSVLVGSSGVAVFTVRLTALLGMTVPLKVTCNYGDTTLVTPILSVSLVAPVLSISSVFPSWALFNTFTPNITLSLFVVLPVNSTVSRNFALGSITGVSPSDVVCALDATTVADGNNVPYNGGTLSLYSAANSAVTMAPIALSPSLATARQPINMTLGLSCTFRQLSLNSFTIPVMMQNVSLAWMTAAPISIQSSTASRTYNAPPLSVALKNQTNGILLEDSSAVCTLAAASGTGADKQVLSKQQIVLDGTFTVTAQRGIATFSNWNLIAPLGSHLVLMVTCTRAEGGPSMTVFTNTSVQWAEVSLVNASSLDTSTSSFATLLWNVDATLTALVKVRVPRQATNTSNYTLATYNASLNPATYCSLNVDASGASALFTGDSALYSSVAVSITGYAFFTYRLTADQGSLIYLRVSCQYGDTYFQLPSLIPVLVSPMLLSWFPSAPSTSPFLFNVAGKNISTQIRMMSNVTSTIVTLPTSVLSSISISDIVCALDASTKISGVATQVPYSGGALTVSLVDGTATFSALSLQPPLFDGQIAVTTTISCAFRGLALNQVAFSSSMQNLSAVWVKQLPQSLMPSTSSSTFYGADVAVSLLDQNSSRLSGDSSSACTLTLTGGTDSNGNAIAAQSLIIGGSTTAKAVNGTATFSKWYIVAPLQSVVFVRMECNRAEGGFPIVLLDTVAMSSAEVSIVAYDTLDPSHAAAVAFYDTPISVLTRVRLRVPMAKGNASNYNVTSFNATVAPPTLCSAGLDAVLLGTLGVSATLGGDPRTFQSIAANASGFSRYSIRLQANSGLNIPIRISCLFGDTSIQTSVFYVRISSVFAAQVSLLPALMPPSTLDVLLPSARPLAFTIRDEFGRLVVDDPALQCLISSTVVGLQDRTLGTLEVSHDSSVFESRLYGPSTTGLIAANGVVNFTQLAIAATLGTIINVTVECSRSNGGDSAVMVQTVFMTAIQAMWRPDATPPSRVLYNTPYLVGIKVDLQTATGISWPWAAYNATAIASISCSLQVSDADAAAGAALGGGAKAQAARVNDEGIANFTLVLVAPGSFVGHISVTCQALGTVIATLTVDSTVEVLVASLLQAPPDVFYPSTNAAKWPVSPYPLVRVTNKQGLWVDASGVACRVLINASALDASTWPNQDYLPRLLDPPEEGYLYSKQRDGMLLSNIVPSSWWGTVVPLYVQCTRPQGDPIPTIPWSLRIMSASSRWLQAVPVSQTPGAPFTISVALWNENAGTLLQEDNTTTCVISMNVSVQRGRTTAVAGVATFSDVIALAMPSSANLLQIHCFAGDMPYINSLADTLRVAGCDIGWQPIGLGLASCGKCSDGQFSDGGAMFCRKCPYGVKCADGVLQLLPNMFLAVSPAALLNPDQYGINVTSDGRLVAIDLSSDTEIHPCWNSEACVVNSTDRTYGCSQGYTGVLCGVCDAPNDWVKQGSKCQKCGSSAINMFVLALIFIFFILVLIYVSIFMDFATDSAAKTVWRILVNYVSALGAMSLYVAHGPDAFQTGVSAFQSIVLPGSGTGLQIAPLQCELHMNFYTRYVSVVTFPLVAACICVLINITQVVTVNVARGLEVVSQELRAFWHTHRPIAVAALVLFMAYPSITSQAFTIFACKPETIAGVHYMELDLDVSCDTTAHALAVTLSSILIGLLCGGLPIVFTFWLYRNQKSVRLGPHSHFFETFGFLYQGYKVDKWYHYSWEALIMIRKAFIVAIAATTKDPIYQMGALQLLLVFNFGMTLHIAPFSRKMFNYLEAMTLLVLIVTQAINLMYLRATTLASALTSSTVSATVLKEQQAVVQASPGLLDEIAAEVVLYLLNGLMVAVLVYTYFRIRRKELASTRTCRQLILDYLGVYRRQPELMFQDLEHTMKKSGQHKYVALVSMCTACSHC